MYPYAYLTLTFLCLSGLCLGCQNDSGRVQDLQDRLAAAEARIAAAEATTGSAYEDSSRSMEDPYADSSWTDGSSPGTEFQTDVPAEGVVTSSAPLNPGSNLDAPFTENPFTDPRNRQGGSLGTRPMPSGVFNPTPMPEGQSYREGNDLFYPGQDNLER